jgi:hypothetical protein
VVLAKSSEKTTAFKSYRAGPPCGDLSIDLSTEAVAKAEASAKLEALRGHFFWDPFTFMSFGQIHVAYAT